MRSTCGGGVCPQIWVWYKRFCIWVPEGLEASFAGNDPSSVGVTGSRQGSALQRTAGSAHTAQLSVTGGFLVPPVQAVPFSLSCCLRPFGHQCKTQEQSRLQEAASDRQRETPQV